MPIPTIGSRAILVIEDHELSASLIIEMLRTAFPGQTLHLAGTAGLGFSEFVRLSPPLLVTDIGLPDGSGLDLIRKAIAVDPQARVVVYSADDSAVMREGAAAAGAQAFVAKSNPRELVHVVSRLLAEIPQVENSPQESPERPTDTGSPSS